MVAATSRGRSLCSTKTHWSQSPDRFIPGIALSIGTKNTDPSSLCHQHTQKSLSDVVYTNKARRLAGSLY